MSLFKPKSSQNQQPDYNDGAPFIAPTAQQNAQKQGNDNSLTEEEAIQTKTDSSQEQFIKPQATLQRKQDPNNEVQPENQPEEVSSEKEGEAKSEAVPSSSTYWTHDWHTDRFGNEALFIWEVGGKRRYSNGDRGYAYIREKAALLPGDTGYDERFERYKHRPQAHEGKDTKLNWWIKRTPGWDNPNHADNGTADFNDLAEFKGASENKKGTGFYYMGFVFDPLIYEKLAEQKRSRENQKYIGNLTNYRGYVSAPNGIILHDTPSPYDKAYNSKRDNADFIIPFNQPITIVGEGNQENEGWVLVRDSSGNEGWIERSNTSKKAEVKSNQVFDTYTVKSGDTVEELIKSNYPDYPTSTGNDRRTVALAIYLYNKNKPGSGVYRDHSKYKSAASWKDTIDPWMQETRANYASMLLYIGGEVILPPVGYISKMVQVGLVEKRPDFVNAMVLSGRMTQGFIAGVGIGFYDAIIETGEDLYNMIVDIFTGEIFNQIADMFKMFMEKGFGGIGDMIKEFASGMWEEAKAAWDNPNPYQKGQYFGEIVGMILFEVVVAILTSGIGNSVKISAKAQKLLKWFPSLEIKKAKIVPKDIDNYSDDLHKLNRDKADLDKDKKNGDRDKDRDKDSEENKGEDAKALIVAKGYVEAEDARDPSPSVETIVGAINRMSGTKLSGGKRYKSKPNGMGAGHFEIYYNPPVKKDYTEGRENSNAPKESSSTQVPKELAKEAYEKWPWKNANASLSELTLGGGKCEMCAAKIQQAIGGDIIHIVDKFGAPKIGRVYNKQGKLISSEFYEHFAVRKGDFIFDRITGPDGMHISDYKRLFEYGKYLTY